MSLLIRLPQDVYSQVLSLWIFTKDLTLLETAFCSVDERPELLKIICDSRFTTTSDEYDDSYSLNWLILRGVRPLSLYIGRSQVEKSGQVNTSKLQRLYSINHTDDHQQLLLLIKSCPELNSLSLYTTKIFHLLEKRILNNLIDIQFSEFPVLSDGNELIQLISENCTNLEIFELPNVQNADLPEDFYSFNKDIIKLCQKNPKLQSLQVGNITNISEILTAISTHNKFIKAVTLISYPEHFCNLTDISNFILNTKTIESIALIHNYEDSDETVWFTYKNYDEHCEESVTNNVTDSYRYIQHNRNSGVNASKKSHEKISFLTIWNCDIQGIYTKDTTPFLNLELKNIVFHEVSGVTDSVLSALLLHIGKCHSAPATNTTRNYANETLQTLRILQPYYSEVDTFTVQGLRTILNSCVNLHRIKLANCQHITNAGFIWLFCGDIYSTQHGSNDNNSSDSCSESRDCVVYKTPKQPQHSISELKITHHKTLTTETVQTILTHNPQITNTSFTGCRYVLG